MIGNAFADKKHGEIVAEVVTVMQEQIVRLPANKLAQA